jgi:hypothetical protein
MKEFPKYKWISGWTNYRVVREYEKGKFELVCKIPKSVDDSDIMSELITRTLNNYKL